MSKLTKKQEESWPRYVEDASRYLDGYTIKRELHYWVVDYWPETRPGRGHDIEAVYLDGEVFAHLYMDVYGNGSLSVGTTNTVHGSSWDECPCKYCEEDNE